MISKKAEKELLAGGASSQLRKDLNKVRQNRHNPFLVDGQVDIDRYLTFLNEFNAFINHQPKPLRRIIDKDMKL